MNTTERRDRLLNLLHRGTTTVPAVATALGVSERTVYRDISVLRGSGHTIDATPGPGGGIRVAPDTRPRAVHFEVDEIIGLTLSVAILKATPHMPFARSAEAALDRARRALSADRQRALKRLQRRILIGGPATDRTKHTLGPIDEALLPIFEQCFTGGRVLSFDYADAQGACTSRRIECMALLLETPCWYVLAWDLDKDAARTFRMDRMSAPQRGRALEDTHALAEVMTRTCPEAEGAFVEWLGRPIG